MLVWVLCLKLWWLVLPLSTLARPRSARTYERRTTPSNLEPRDGALISDLESRNFADTVERRAGPSGITKPLIINADGEPMWMTQLLGAEDPLKPVLRQLNETDALNATQLGYGFWKSVKAREPFDFYFPPDDIPFGPRRGKYIVRLPSSHFWPKRNVCIIAYAD